MEQIKDYEKISYSDFKTIKYDQKYPDSILFIGNINTIFSMSRDSFPDHHDILSLIQKWDKQGGYNNLGSAQWSIYYRVIQQILNKNDLTVEDTISLQHHSEALSKTKKYLLKHFGKVDILLGELQRHTRGNFDLPVSGLTDMIAPSYVVDDDNGKFKVVSGESYIMLTRYSKKGVEIETVIPYGNSNDPSSPHFTDQMQLYVDKRLKKMTLDKNAIFSDAVKIYNPN